VVAVLANILQMRSDGIPVLGNVEGDGVFRRWRDACATCGVRNKSTIQIQCFIPTRHWYCSNRCYTSVGEASTVCSAVKVNAVGYVPDSIDKLAEAFAVVRAMELPLSSKQVLLRGIVRKDTRSFMTMSDAVRCLHAPSR